MSRQQFGSGNNSTKVLSFQKSGSTASFDPTITFSSGSRRVSWRLDNGSGIKQVAGNSIIYTGFTGDSNLRTIEMRGSSFENINFFILDDENLYGNLNLSSIPNIGGSIRLENNPLLTGVTHSPSTNNVTNYRVRDCNLIGNLDLTPLSGLGGAFEIYSNPNLTGITHAVSTNTFNLYQANDCNLTGNLNLTPLSGFGGSFFIYSNTNLTSITHSYTTNNINVYWAFNCKLTGNHDVSMFPNLGGYFHVGSNSNLTGITHTTTTRTFSNYTVNGCNLIGNLDLSMLSNLGGIINLTVNTSLTGVTFPASSSQPLIAVEIASCNLIGTLDLTGFGGFGGPSSASTSPSKTSINPNLSNVLFPIGNGYIKNQINNSANAAFGFYSCDFGYIDFKPLSGCTLISGVTEGIPRFELYNNSMTTADVNHILSDFDLISNLNYSGWTSTSGTSSGYIDISLNSAPDGSSGGYNGTGATINLISKGWTIITD